MLSIGTLININNNAASPEFIINEKLNTININVCPTIPLIVLSQTKSEKVCCCLMSRVNENAWIQVFHWIPLVASIFAASGLAHFSLKRLTLKILPGKFYCPSSTVLGMSSSWKSSLSLSVLTYRCLSFLQFLNKRLWSNFAFFHVCLPRKNRIMLYVLNPVYSRCSVVTNQTNKWTTEMQFYQKEERKLYWTQ